MSTNELGAVWDQVDAAVALNREARRLQLNQILEKARARSDAASNPDTLYLIAYCRYVHPARLDSNSGRIQFEESALAVLNVDPSYTRARLYLGFHYFDVSDWKSAARWLAEVNIAELLADDRVKVQELKICLQLREYGLPGALTSIDSFVNDCLREDEFDVFPVHLLQLLPQVASKTADRDVIERTVHLIGLLVKRTHQERIFAKELKALKDVLSQG